MTTCQHPPECLDDDGDCRWCDDIADLRRTINGLIDQLEAKAVIVNNGSPHFSGPIGYLVVKGGSVILNSPVKTILAPLAPQESA